MNGQIPLTVITGEQTNISPYLDFHFWQEVFFEVPGGGEQLACWYGPSHKQGDFLTYFILLNDSEYVVTRSNVRNAKEPIFPSCNQWTTPADGNTSVPVSQPVVTSIQDYYDEPISLPKFSPDELLGMMVLRTLDEEVLHVKVVHKIMDHDSENHQQTKFLLSLGDRQLEEIISYNEFCDLVMEKMDSKDNGHHDFIIYSGILDHQGPLKNHDPRYKGSTYNILINWEDGTQTWEPLNFMAKQDLVMVAKYAYNHDLLNTPGWKFLCQTAKRQQFIHRILNAI